MKKNGRLSRLIYSSGSSGSKSPVEGPDLPNSRSFEAFHNVLPNDELDKEEELQEFAKHFSLDAQDANEDDSLHSFVSGCSTSSVREIVKVRRESQSTLVSSEAPGRLQTGHEEVLPAKDRHEFDKLLSRSHNSASPRLRDPHTCFEPLATATNATQFDKLWRTLQKQRSWSTESSRNEAWERRRDLYLLEELNDMKVDGDSRSLGRCISDCGERTSKSLQQGTKFRTRTLTDEDLDELRGCIDLGFGFGSKEDPHLRNTLPALELCYALERQLSSPSVSDGDIQNFSVCESPLSSPESTWRVSNPGDNPQQVKMRLRHWAQAVACSVRQSW